MVLGWLIVCLVILPVVCLNFKLLIKKFDGLYQCNSTYHFILIYSQKGMSC